MKAEYSNSATPWGESGYIPTYPPSGGTNTPANTRAYQRNYTYDRLGNLLKLEHDAGAGASFNRYFNDYDTAPGAAYQTQNTATKIKAGTFATNYTFDVCGNMIQEGVSRHFEYDAGDVLRAFYEDGGAGTEPSTFTRCRQNLLPTRG